MPGTDTPFNGTTKIEAAKKLCDVLGTGDDATDYITDHPKEIEGLDKLSKAIEGFDAAIPSDE